MKQFSPISIWYNTISNDSLIELLHVGVKTTSANHSRSRTDFESQLIYAILNYATNENTKKKEKIELWKQ
ncbi:hypothetical protein BpHYR1_037425 [Brachionus plicatilis]|uniref:Uncharacterized protein n=1 Tax=Brachionus plicatilis TaxID=10195 RepID=A0A3M7Q1B1_BRAPC|nr:hypothetical protein BpHYR1_037425 [Brachionus plicatilis]